jgi:hypothetical protein
MIEAAQNTSITASLEISGDSIHLPNPPAALYNKSFTHTFGEFRA